MQMKHIRVRDSKFGLALVIETRANSGGYMLGFRVDPLDKLEEIASEVKSLHRVFAETPIFGIEYEVDDKPGTYLRVKP